MAVRLICLLIGYACGNFMTAEIVTRKITGKPCSELGTTGNPGMANVMAHLGFKAGIITLAGDLGKTCLACLLCALWGSPEIGHIAVLYGGLGATLGHCWPVWMKPGRGGKGVAASCMALFLFSPLWGAVANIAGMLIVFATQYLCLGGIAIPAIFILPAFLVYGKEAGILSVVIALLCFSKHWPAARLIPQGKCEKTDVLGEIRKHLG